MTADEITTMSRAVAQHFGLWTPGSICHYNSHGYACTHGIYLRDHDIPCPDLTQPEWAWRLLEVLTNRAITVMFHACQPDDEGVTMAPGQVWVEMVCKRYRTSFYSGADVPRRALLEAAYQLVQREGGREDDDRR